MISRRWVLTASIRLLWDTKAASRQWAGEVAEGLGEADLLWRLNKVEDAPEF